MAKMKLTDEQRLNLVLNKPRSREEMVKFLQSLLGREPDEIELNYVSVKDNAGNYYLNEDALKVPAESKRKLLLGKASKEDLVKEVIPPEAIEEFTVPPIAPGPSAAVEGAAATGGFLGRVGSKIKGSTTGLLGKIKDHPFMYGLGALGAGVVGSQVASQINEDFLGGWERKMARKAAEQEQELDFLTKKAKIAAEQTRDEADLKMNQAMSPESVGARQRAKAEDVQRDLLKRQLDEVYAPDRFDNILLGIQAISPNTDYVEKAFLGTP